MTKTIEVLKKGEPFRKIGKLTVFVRGDFNRSLKKYECSKWEDINSFTHLKKGTLVEVGFDF